jgi:hypothetical protein
LSATCSIVVLAKESKAKKPCSSFGGGRRSRGGAVGRPETGTGRALPEAASWNRNTATPLILLGYCPARRNTIRHSSRNGPARNALAVDEAALVSFQEHGAAGMLPL